MTIDPDAEVAKYDALYAQDKTYKMGETRKAAVCALLSEGFNAAKAMKPPPEWLTLLDVGCGRGEACQMAADIGYEDVIGADASDIVTYPPTPPKDYSLICCHAWEQPFDDREFDTVTCFDVLEHLPPDFVAKTITELGRVANRRLLLTAAWKPDIRNGVDLHISARPTDEWDQLIRFLLCPTWVVTHRKDVVTGTSETWECLRANLGG